MLMQTAPSPVVSALPALVVLLIAGGMLVLFLFISGTIFKKAGYSFWMALLMLVPIGNLVWLIVFAFSDWPVLRELRAYRAREYGHVPGAFPVAPPSYGNQPRM